MTDEQVFRFENKKGASFFRSSHLLDIGRLTEVAAPVRTPQVPGFLPVSGQDQVYSTQASRRAPIVVPPPEPFCRMRRAHAR